MGPKRGGRHPQACDPRCVAAGGKDRASGPRAGGQPDEAGSGRLPGVAMMQAADFGKLHDPAQREPFERPPVWGIFLEREVSPSAVIVREVACQDSAEVRLVKNEDMGQTLLPDRADEPGLGRVKAPRHRHRATPHQQEHVSARG